VGAATRGARAKVGAANARQETPLDGSKAAKKKTTTAPQEIRQGDRHTQGCSKSRLKTAKKARAERSAQKVPRESPPLQKSAASSNDRPVETVKPIDRSYANAVRSALCSATIRFLYPRSSGFPPRDNHGYSGGYYASRAGCSRGHHAHAEQGRSKPERLSQCPIQSATTPVTGSMCWDEDVERVFRQRPCFAGGTVLKR
jgi:hypothetical protein